MIRDNQSQINELTEELTELESKVKRVKDELATVKAVQATLIEQLKKQ
jgi:predicted nuclease with TOPRIM domain